jgi:hypothetical protein
MIPVYGGKFLSHKAVHNWVEKFSQGRSKVAGDARPSRPVKIATGTTMQREDKLIRVDRRITIDSVATALGCFHGVAYSTMHDRLKFVKCAGRVPRELKNREEMNRMGLSLQHLLVLPYANEGEDMLNRNVTGDESWVHHYQPESKRGSIQWKHPSSPRSIKRFKVLPPAGKIMLTVF